MAHFDQNDNVLPNSNQNKTKQMTFCLVTIHHLLLFTRVATFQGHLMLLLPH
jgi:hypothetical protein